MMTTARATGNDTGNLFFVATEVGANESPGTWELPALPRKAFLATMHNLMDVKGNGRISKEEFVWVCRLLEQLGVLNARVVSEARKRANKRKGEPRGPVHPQLLDLRGLLKAWKASPDPEGTVFRAAFDRYDTNGNGDLDLTEWTIFAAEWLDWGKLDAVQ